MVNSRRSLPRVDGKRMKQPNLAMKALNATEQSLRRSAGSESQVLPNIYLDDVNIAVWERELPEMLTLSSEKILEKNPNLEISLVTTQKEAFASVVKAIGSEPEAIEMGEDVAKLVDMFCCLFELKRVGLRLTVLDRAMCPRFHVDRIPCRLITTYKGAATEWLPQHSADRSKLGIGNEGKPDDQSGIFGSARDIRQLSEGDVALLKGEAWEGNQGGGLIHRSPGLTSEARRLLLTLDFVD